MCYLDAGQLELLLTAGRVCCTALKAVVLREELIIYIKSK